MEVRTHNENSCYEVVLEFLDGSICIVGYVVDWGYYLVLGVHVSHFTFECCVGFIIHDAKYWIESPGFEVCGKFGEFTNHLLVTNVIHCRSQDCISII